jgi:hypothetical protein
LVVCAAGPALAVNPLFEPCQKTARPRVLSLLLALLICWPDWCASCASVAISSPRERRCFISVTSCIQVVRCIYGCCRW